MAQGYAVGRRGCYRGQGHGQARLYGGAMPCPACPEIGYRLARGPGDGRERCALCAQGNSRHDTRGIGLERATASGIRRACRRGTGARPCGRRASQPLSGRHRFDRAVGGDDGPPAQYRRAALRPSGRRRLRGVAPCRRRWPGHDRGVLPRTSALVRKASGEPRPQLLAANVDVVFIVTAPDGDFNLPRIERYLALGARQWRRSGHRPQQGGSHRRCRSGLTGQIAAIAPGVPIHAISARARDGVRDLERYFDGNRTVGLIGSSGVGKSTLTNELLGRAAQATQEVRAHDSRGRHTTTHRQLFTRPQGGAIIDTPGMRGVELWNTAQERRQRFRRYRGPGNPVQVSQLPA